MLLWVFLGSMVLGTILVIIQAKVKGKEKQESQQAQSPNRFSGMSATEIAQEASKLVAAPTKTEKPASVIKRGVAGTIIGGVPGAIIGAASAIDKNNRSKK